MTDFKKWQAEIESKAHQHAYDTYESRLAFLQGIIPEYPEQINKDFLPKLLHERALQPFQEGYTQCIASKLRIVRLRMDTFLEHAYLITRLRGLTVERTKFRLQKERERLERDMKLLLKLRQSEAVADLATYCLRLDELMLKSLSEAIAEEEQGVRVVVGDSVLWEDEDGSLVMNATALRDLWEQEDTADHREYCSKLLGMTQEQIVERIHDLEIVERIANCE